MNKINNLLRQYFVLEEGVLIKHHQEILKLIEIDAMLSMHPHAGKRVYISRRALKHVVESRKKDLLKKHTKEEALDVILFALESVPEVIINFDNYQLEPINKHFYTKDFSEAGMPKVRVLLELYNEKLLIKSIHFMKRTKKHHN